VATRPEPDLDRLVEQLHDADVAVVLQAVWRAEERLAGSPDAEFRQTLEALLSLFYVDLVDRPDLEDAIDRVVEVVARQGARAVPVLLAQMRSSDIKSHLHLARSLAHMGREALPALRELAATDEDRYARTFALYALGKMSCPEVVQSLPEVIGGLMHPDREVRDTAARTLGKIARVAPLAELTRRRRQEMFEALLRATHDREAPVRAKAMRSLGVMGEVGLLDEEQKGQVERGLRAALGESDEGHWDQAYIVRREAREALGKL